MAKAGDADGLGDRAFDPGPDRVTVLHLSSVSSLRAIPDAYQAMSLATSSWAAAISVAVESVMSTSHAYSNRGSRSASACF